MDLTYGELTALFLMALLTLLVVGIYVEHRAWKRQAAIRQRRLQGGK